MQALSSLHIQGSKGKRPNVQETESSFLERITDAFIALDDQWRFVHVNRQAAEILGRDRYELLGKQYWTEFPAAVGSPFYQAYHQAMAEQTPRQIERYSNSMGRWFENRIYPAPDGLTIFFTDITERKQLEVRLSATALRLEAVISNLQAGVVVEDNHGQIVLTNQAFCDMMGLAGTPEALVGSSLSVVAQLSKHLFADPPAFLARLKFLSRRQKAVEAEELTLLDGRVWERDYVPVFPDGGGDGYGGHLWLFRDVTERRKIEQQVKEDAVALEHANQELARANAELEALATTDELTALKNHRVFVERLREEFRRARRYGEPLSLIMLDVDHFKDFNDAFGHVEGNRVLRQVASVLQANGRETDLVTRYGGEEFAVILPHTRRAEAERIGERLRVAIEAQAWEHRPVTASLGVCELTEAMPDPKALVSVADAAMYRSKSEGRNRVTCAGD